MEPLRRLLDARPEVAGSAILWREIVGNVFGLASALLGMRRVGYVEFWLIWIAVDAVGVPLLLGSGFYPSAAMYAVYGLFCAWGFVSWLRTSQVLSRVTGQTSTSYAEAAA